MLLLLSPYVETLGMTPRVLVAVAGVMILDLILLLRL